jgi:hypothetical protein
MATAEAEMWRDQMGDNNGGNEPCMKAPGTASPSRLLPPPTYPISISDYLGSSIWWARDFPRNQVDGCVLQTRTASSRIVGETE